MQAAVEYMQHYINTYSNQPDYQRYTDRAFIDDMLYGIGVALYGDEAKNSDGYHFFRDKLREHLGCEKTFFGAWVNTQETNDEIEKRKRLLDD